MGVEYSGCCVGYERNKMPKSHINFNTRMVDTWPNQGVQSTPDGLVMLNAEEAYMVKKQESLNLHLIPCAKLKQRIESCLENTDTDISQAEFCAILAECKLLKADFPRTDTRWMKFYARFLVRDNT